MVLLFVDSTFMDWLLEESIIYTGQDQRFRILASLFFQYELGKDKAYISETLFSFIFFSFVLWTFHPFIFQSKKIYTVLLWRRVLAFLVVSADYSILSMFLQASQTLRIITFYSTQLPGPNYHCREVEFCINAAMFGEVIYSSLLLSFGESKFLQSVMTSCPLQGSKLARLPRPDSVLEVLLINFPRGVIYGCGDLIFSSHMIFTLVFVLTYQKYGSQRFFKQLAWSIAVIQSLLIIASRKHYTVDVVVAWYTVNLVVFFVDKKLPELPDRPNGNSSPLLPLSTKDKDSWTKEEHHQILNGNSADTADWRPRTQVNGKILENGNTVHDDTAMNGT
ncbi:hypothetical protein HHK36_016282 [Tetracentron sinense]|uniref:Sphingomyelin synthase-like domain-containing protein n=1 Tax=Tetracentron sinense TaxID=13715 RepID=A0A835DEJ8_TETSI|nr:hypothetical protein HHK36_016282 [Tetracentron sinense]